jgi:multiple sugar transport system permease protein
VAADHRHHTDHDHLLYLAVSEEEGTGMRKILLCFSVLLALAWSLLPIYWLLNSSLMFNVEVLAVPTHLWPHHPTLANYISLLGFTAAGFGGQPMLPSAHSEAVTTGLKNSLIVASVVTALTLIIGLPVAYAIGRLSFRRKNLLLFGILFSRSYPPFVILIAFYSLYQALGLYGTRLGLIIIYLTLTIPLVVWIMMGVFASLPQDAEREARVDGCTRWQAFYRVLLPMAASGVAACAAIAFLVSWNEFTFSFVLAGGTPAQTFPPALAGMFFLSLGQPTQMPAATIMGIIPPLLLAYLFQRRIRQLNIVDPL